MITSSVSHVPIDTWVVKNDLSYFLAQKHSDFGVTRYIHLQPCILHSLNIVNRNGPVAVTFDRDNTYR